MKNFFSLVGALLLSALVMAPAQAGQWELLRYERQASYKNKHIAYGGDSIYNNGVATEVDSQHYKAVWSDGKEKATLDGKEQPYLYSNAVEAGWNDGRGVFKGSRKRGGQEATASGTLSITPVFRWKRNQSWGFFGPYDDPNDNPPKELFYVENATISGYEGMSQYDGNSLPFSLQNPFTNKGCFKFEDVRHPFSEAEPVHSITQGPNGYGASHQFSVGGKEQRVTKKEAQGDEVRGETRTFQGNITLTTAYADGRFFDCRGQASLNFGYSATPTSFQFGVSANAFEDSSTHPRDKQLSAYAGKNYTGRDPNSPETPIHFFWDGTAGYTTNIAPSLGSVLGNPTYEWKVEEGGGPVALHYLDPNVSVLSQEFDESVAWKPTANKQFHHDVQEMSPGGDSYSSRKQAEWPKTTVTTVKITGNNEQKSKLTAKAKIDWYRQPYTRYRAEVETEVYDYNTGTTKTLDEVMQASVNPLTTDEDRYVDEFTTDYEAMKKEFITTGATYVGMALEAEMMVGSWYVPDEVDVGTFGLSLLGKPIRKAFKAAKTLKAGVELAAKINRVRDKLSAAVPAVKKALGHDNFLIVMKRKKFRELRGGHVGSDGKRVEAAMGEVKEEEEVLCKIPGGGSCFVAGTLVSSEHGSRAIETIKKDDLVWSRDAATGKTELKRVKQTFERYSATLVLTFSNGEKIETTKEHPFYVEGRGFVPAGEMGIGTSIVTRARPAVQLVSTSVGQAQKVFNFEVEDFHSYFVGTGEAWVHNACLPANLWSLDPVTRGNLIEDWVADGVYTSADGWFRVGATHNGYFPLIDFQKGTDVISLKSVNPASSTAISRMQDHLDDLGASNITVAGVSATKILDIRVPPGQQNALSSLVAYGRNLGVTVRIGTAP